MRAPPPTEMAEEESRPPPETPWVISSLKSVKESLRNVGRWKQQWFVSYPGPKASHEMKNAWARAIEDDCKKSVNQLDETRPHEPTAVIRDILHTLATDQVEVQLLVSRCKIREFGLKNNAATTIYETASPHTHEEPQFALLATVHRHKSTKTQDVIDELLLAVRLPINSYVRCAPLRTGLESEADINFHLPERLGEALPFPGKLNTVVAFEVLRAGQPETMLETSCRQFCREHTDKGLGFMFVPRHDIENDTYVPPVADDNYHVLWFTQESEVDRVRRHLRWGEGETERVKGKLLQKCNERGNLRLQMLMQELTYAKHLEAQPKLPKRMAATLALTLEILNDPRFIKECDDVKTAVGIVKEIGDFWRLHVFKNAPTALGLGIPGNLASANTSFDALLSLLANVKKRLETIVVKTEHVDYPVKFHCLPRKQSKSSKKRAHPGTPPSSKPTPSASVVSPAAMAASTSMKGLPRPAGRAPSDSQGETMIWNSDKGWWMSRRIPSETKVPGAKKPKL